MWGAIQDVWEINTMPKTKKRGLGVMDQVSEPGVPKNDARYKLTRGKGAPRGKGVFLSRRGILLTSFQVKRGF